MVLYENSERMNAFLVTGAVSSKKISKANIS